MSDLGPESQVTQQDAIYAKLRQWLTVGRFLPGERLKIRQVAAQLGVGLMPVRAALQRLAAEGALSNTPNAGVAVPLLNVAEFDDLVQTRLLLEGEAAERGALRLQATDLASMDRLSNTMADALRSKDGPQADAYLAANEDFHVLLYKAAGSPLLFHLIDTLWLKAGPVSNRLFQAQGDTLRKGRQSGEPSTRLNVSAKLLADPAEVAHLNDAHEDLLQALRRRDPLAARQAVERDIFVSAQRLKVSLKLR